MTTTFVTVPPALTDMHYWLFGMFVLLAIPALLCGILVARAHIQVGSDTFILTAMIGLFIGSLIALAMNIIPFYFSVMTLALLVLYFWKGRG